MAPEVCSGRRSDLLSASGALLGPIGQASLLDDPRVNLDARVANHAIPTTHSLLAMLEAERITTVFALRQSPAGLVANDTVFHVFFFLVFLCLLF